MTSRIIQDVGTADAVWLPWLAELDVQGASASQLCPPGARLVVVAPHPDDEVLMCGGLLALRAALKLPTLVVAVTDGEASHGEVSHGEEAAAQHAGLAMRRVQESAAGLMALGLPDVPVTRLHLPDGHLSSAGSARALEHALCKLLLPADIVVTTWRLDGHPDHEACAAAAGRAASQVGCTVLQAPVWMWHWATPGDVRVDWRKLLVLELPATAVKLKQQALQRHHSQLEPRGNAQEPVLVASIVERAARAREYFFRD